MGEKLSLKKYNQQVAKKRLLLRLATTNGQRGTKERNSLIAKHRNNTLINDRHQNTHCESANVGSLFSKYPRHIPSRTVGQRRGLKEHLSLRCHDQVASKAFRSLSGQTRVFRLVDVSLARERKSILLYLSSGYFVCSVFYALSLLNWILEATEGNRS